MFTLHRFFREWVRSLALQGCFAFHACALSHTLSLCWLPWRPTRSCQFRSQSMLCRSYTTVLFHTVLLDSGHLACRTSPYSDIATSPYYKPLCLGRCSAAQLLRGSWKLLGHSLLLSLTYGFCFLDSAWWLENEKYISVRSTCSWLQNCSIQTASFPSRTACVYLIVRLPISCTRLVQTSSPEWEDTV